MLNLYVILHEPGCCHIKRNGTAPGPFGKVSLHIGRWVSYQLGQLEDIIGEQLGDSGNNFIRLGRGLIINSDFVYSIDIAKQQLILSDCLDCYHELSASREVLIKLKAYLDALIEK